MQEKLAGDWQTWVKSPVLPEWNSNSLRVSLSCFHLLKVQWGRKGGEKKERKKDVTHRPHFKGRSNCAVLGERWWLGGFSLIRHSWFQYFPCYPYIFSVLSSNPQMPMFIIVEGLWRLSQPPERQQISVFLQLCEAPWCITYSTNSRLLKSLSLDSHWNRQWFSTVKKETIGPPNGVTYISPTSASRT